MAVEPKLSDQEIASRMEIPHPSRGMGESTYGATKIAARKGALINTIWMF